MNSIQTKPIIEGFDEDFARIQEEFEVSSPNLRLSDFFTYWQQNHLDCLFANRFDPRELFESIKELYSFLIEQTSSRKSKIITLYFLLCLYCRQPKSLRIKIRMTIDDFGSFQEVLDESDPKFVWTRLISMKAFELVEDRNIYGPSMLNRKKKKVVEIDDSYIQDKIEPNVVELDSLCAPYEMIREALGLGERGSIGELLIQAKSLLHNLRGINSGLK